MVQEASSWSHSSALGVLGQAGALISFDDIDQVWAKMEQQHVLYMWQIPYIDSVQWVALGAPVGLVTAVRHIMAQHGSAVQNADQDPARSDQDPTRSEAAQQAHESQRNSLWTGSSQSDGVLRPEESTSMWSKARTIWRVSELKDWIMPFQVSPTFRKGLVNAKTSAALRDYVLNDTDMWIVLSALTFSVVVSLWGMFPKQDHISPTFAVAFNMLAAVTNVLCFTAVVNLSVLRILGDAVDFRNFKHFAMLNRPFFSFSMFCITGFIYGTLAMITLLLHARIAAILPKAGVWIATGVMLGFDAMVAVIHIFFANFGSRTLFHGGLMIANVALDVSGKYSSSKAMEQSMNAAVMEGLVFDPEETNAKYREILADSTRFAPEIAKDLHLSGALSRLINKPGRTSSLTHSPPDQLNALEFPSARKIDEVVLCGGMQPEEVDTLTAHHMQTESQTKSRL